MPMGTDEADADNGLAGRGERRLGRHRVEHRHGDGTTADCGVIVCVPHHTALAPFAAHLALVGRATGEVVLVDEATGTVVARRALRGSPRRGWRGPAAKRDRRRPARQQPPTAAADSPAGSDCGP